MPTRFSEDEDAIEHAGGHDDEINLSVSGDVGGQINVAGDDIITYQTVIQQTPLPLLVAVILGLAALAVGLVVSVGMVRRATEGTPTGPVGPSGGVTLSPTEIALTATAQFEQTVADVRAAVIAFDRQMRIALETGNITGLSAVARQDALEDRLNAVNILRAAGNCHWVYNQRGLTVIEVTFTSPDRAEATASVDRDGRVFCDDGERSQYAFNGPYTATYVVEVIQDQWLVTDYHPATEE